MILYLANPTKVAQPYMAAGILGYIDTPAQGNKRPPDVMWCADNGCFGKGYPGDQKWLAWLAKNSHDAESCLFATAPDVVGEAAETLERSRPFLPAIRDLGYRAALVGQDGMEDLEVPWDEFDAFFVGGSTEWKLSDAASDLAREAKRRGKHIHLGRVNSLKRMRFAKQVGYDSVDGTFLVFGPRVNLPRLLRWLEEINEVPDLTLNAGEHGSTDYRGDPPVPPELGATG